MATVKRCCENCRSRLALASQLPSGLKATAWTLDPWPFRLRTSLPVTTSQSFTVLSALPVASQRPSGLKATALTQPRWPLAQFVYWSRIVSGLNQEHA
jgi:hypothetical protein